MKRVNEKIPEEDLLKGHGSLVRFDFDKLDRKTGKVRPYGKGFLHADMEVPCKNPEKCRDKEHRVNFTWKQVIRGVFLPLVGTKVSFVALPGTNGYSPSAIRLELRNNDAVK